MSVLSLPRLYFTGQMYWTPSTLNNNDYAPAINTYDIPQAKLNEDYLDQQLVETGDEFKKWVIKPTRANNTKTGGGNYTVPPAEWGYYGGMQCGFVTEESPVIENPDFGLPVGRPLTTVTGYTARNGAYKNSDMWMGLPLQFNKGMVPAKLVDVNPQLPWASQIFADKFTLGSKKMGLGFTAPMRNRMATRWLYNHTYDLDHELMIAGKYSVVFQTGFEKDDLTIFDQDPIGGSLSSEFLDAFEKPRVKGLMIRITAYDTLYFQGKAFEGLTPQSSVGEGDNRTDYMNRIAVLYKQYEEEMREFKLGKRAEAPKTPVNRAYSMCVGWIGLWNEGELATTPGGRYLIPFENPTTYENEITLQPKNLPRAFYTTDKAGTTLGPTAVEVKTKGDEIKRVTVDMGSTIPLTNTKGWRAEVGEVTLGLKVGDTVKKVGDLPYYFRLYLQTAGVIDITDILDKTITADEIRNNPLVITAENYTPNGDTWKSKTITALNEAPATAETDLRGVYLNEPNAPWDPGPKTNEFTVKVWQYGAKPPEGTRLAVAQYDPEGNLIPTLDESNALDAAPVIALSYKDGDRFKPITNLTTILVPASGVVTIRAQALRVGLPNIRFYTVPAGKKYPGPVQSGPMFFTYYTAARVLPFHNHLANDFENWLKSKPGIHEVNRRIFNDVYKTYYLMYPVMRFIDNPLKFQEWRGKILEATDPALFESARYMPVTRALSAGQRHMLSCYLEYLGRLPHPTQSVKRTDRISRG